MNQEEINYEQGAATRLCCTGALPHCSLSPHRMLSEEDDHPPLTAQVFLTNAQIDPNENNQVIRAFVPTGSKRLGCLATLNDTNNVALGTVFCGNRQPSGFGGVPGVLVSVFFPQPAVPNLSIEVLWRRKERRMALRRSRWILGGVLTIALVGVLAGG